ncbi:uncharacterized protein LOC106459255 [Limulus polyphemus]|uniref:Uncharacterized protein LOC106459255 n=1 Tax=Limulus polyphemus TaxID=6850 RepID=A0ABM1B3W2_LIMPO|nr:uncharacterized protein LOC106459255 [Limulus polyphemus]
MNKILTRMIRNSTTLATLFSIFMLASCNKTVSEDMHGNSTILGDVVKLCEKSVSSHNCSLHCTVLLEDILTRWKEHNFTVLMKGPQVPKYCYNDTQCKEIVPGSFCRNISCGCVYDQDQEESCLFHDESGESHDHVCIVTASWTSVYVNVVGNGFPWTKLMFLFIGLFLISLIFMGIRWFLPMFGFCEGKTKLKHNSSHHSGINLVGTELEMSSYDDNHADYASCLKHPVASPS